MGIYLSLSTVRFSLVAIRLVAAGDGVVDCDVGAVNGHRSRVNTNTRQRRHRSKFD